MKRAILFADNGYVLRVGRDEENDNYWEWHYQDAAEEARQNERDVRKRAAMPSGRYEWRGGYKTFDDALHAGLSDIRQDPFQKES